MCLGFPLHRAVERQQVKLAKTLIYAGVDVNRTDHEGRTPLHYACMGLLTKVWDGAQQEGVTVVDKCDLSLVGLLISRGVDVNTVDNYGAVPLEYVCRCHRQGELVGILCQAGANVNLESVLQNLVIGRKRPVGIEYLLDHMDRLGRPLNSLNWSEITSPLHTLCHKRDYLLDPPSAIKCAKLLLERGLSVNVISRVFGETPLHWAVGFGLMGMTKLLLQYDADETLKDKKGLTPLDWVQMSDEEFSKTISKEKREEEWVRIMRERFTELLVARKQGPDADDLLVKAAKGENFVA